jgi:hypothetical protein
MINEYGIEVLPRGSGCVQFVKNDETFNKEGLQLKHQGSRIKPPTLCIVHNIKQSAFKVETLVSKDC